MKIFGVKIKAPSFMRSSRESEARYTTSHDTRAAIPAGGEFRFTEDLATTTFLSFDWDTNIIYVKSVHTGETICCYKMNREENRSRYESAPITRPSLYGGISLPDVTTDRSDRFPRPRPPRLGVSSLSSVQYKYQTRCVINSVNSDDSCNQSSGNGSVFSCVDNSLADNCIPTSCADSSLTGSCSPTNINDSTTYYSSIPRSWNEMQKCVVTRKPTDKKRMKTFRNSYDGAGLKTSTQPEDCVTPQADKITLRHQYDSGYKSSRRSNRSRDPLYSSTSDIQPERRELATPLPPFPKMGVFSSLERGPTPPPRTSSLQKYPNIKRYVPTSKQLTFEDKGCQTESAPVGIVV